MVGLDSLEFSYHDASIADLRCGPEEAELVIPRFIVRDREKEIQYWRERMDQARERMQKEEVEVRMDLLEVKNIIQILYCEYRFGRILVR